MTIPSITHISTSRPLARRAHTCSVCQKPIAIGSRYERNVIRDNDRLDQHTALRVYKWHLVCPGFAAEETTNG